MRFSSLLALGLTSVFLSTAHSERAIAKPCGCQIMAATSDSPTGTCDVREYGRTACELLWGPDPRASGANLGPTDPGPVIRRLLQATTGSGLPPSGGNALPDVERILSGAPFWTEFQNVIESRVRMEAHFYARTLAFLAMQEEVTERPHIAVGALLFVSATSMLRPLPYRTEDILAALINMRQRLVPFARESQTGDNLFTDFSIRTESGEIQQAKARGFVTFGCMEYFIDPVGYAQLIKSPWTRAASRRRMR